MKNERKLKLTEYKFCQDEDCIEKIHKDIEINYVNEICKNTIIKISYNQKSLFFANESE